MATRRARFDASSVTPLYEQVADYVEAQITSGDLKPGQKFPDMRELRERGLVVSRVGKGTFVQDRRSQ
jgi:DNA-binding GntR family transcriptional regulator